MLPGMSLKLLGLLRAKSHLLDSIREFTNGRLHKVLASRNVQEAGADFNNRSYHYDKILD